MYAFNSAAIFLPGHPYIESTTVLSDTVRLLMFVVKINYFRGWGLNRENNFREI